jgi:aspartyl-tRNA(Asn)/glutamyl-tRNA(Gln) amidotransferase subunit A
MDDTLSFASLHDLGARLRSRELSSVELTEHFLRRIERYNPQLNAYIAVTADRALASARAAETALAGGHYLGPLHGIPVALKDLIDIAGLRTTGGSILRGENIAAKDATVARKMAAAGTVLLGKTHMVEFAFGGVGINHHYGTPWNPWDAKTQRIPGGSSSGSGVAVAAGLAPAALGSDTGGSVRIPASFCGLVGLKPTFGRLSNHGCLPLDSTLDSVGPMVRSVHDAALIYQTLAGPDPAAPPTWGHPCEDVLENLEGDISGMRLCLPREYFWDEVDEEVAAAVHTGAQVFADLNTHVEDISLNELDDLKTLRARGSLVAVETYLNLKDDLENNLDKFDPIVSARMLDGKDFLATDYLDIQNGYADLRRRIAASLHSVDALITPTTPLVAAPVEEVDQEGRYFPINGLCLRNTTAANLLGLCAISLPCGFTRTGLPIGLQLIGRAFDEGRLLRLAHAYEAATEWSQRHPEMHAFN